MSNTGKHGNHATGERTERVVVKCAFCGKEKRYLPSFLKLHPIKFCSKECEGLSRRNKIEIKCDNCGTTFLRRPDKLKIKNACSVSCAAELKRKPDAKWRDPEMIKRYMSNYQHNNKDELNRKARERYSTNEDHRSIVKVIKAKWRKSNKEQITVHTGYVRATPGVSANLTVTEWKDILKKYNHSCICCGKSRKEATITMDHIIPLSKGGTHTKENVQPLCKECNSKKHDQTIDYRSKI